MKENKDIPIFYIIGENTDLEAFNEIQNLIEINKGAVNSNLDIKPYLNNTFGLFNIDNEIVNEINKFPPLSLPHLEFSYKNNHDILLQALTKKDKKLKINHKENYLNNEPIIFTADLRNPSQELTNESDLRINISNKNTKKVYEYYFSKKDKSYYLNISTLPKGIYNFTAEARYGNIIYSEKGSFTVDDVGAEAQDLVANSQRMQLLL